MIQTSSVPPNTFCNDIRLSGMFDWSFDCIHMHYAETEKKKTFVKREEADAWVLCCKDVYKEGQPDDIKWKQATTRTLMEA